MQHRPSSSVKYQNFESPNRVRGGAWSEALRANGPLLALVLVYFVVSATIMRGLGFTVQPIRNALLLWSAAIVVGSALLVGCAVHRLVRSKPESPIRFLIKEAKASELAKRAAYGLPIVAILPIFFAAYSGVKTSIDRIVPFYADEWLSDLDRLLHGGNDPWRILEPILAYAPATFAIDYFYRLWFPVIYLALIGAAFMLRDDRLRSQFLLAYFLSWFFLGNLLALALSSVGPCYYEAFGGDERYRPLLTHLARTDEDFRLFAPAVQARLLELYRAGELRFGSGISAMPSMHVALALLVAVFAARINRLLGVAGLIFAATIMIGSVHLGWHYALDGYVSLLLVPPIWIVSGLIADRLPGAGGSRGSAETQSHGD